MSNLAAETSLSDYESEKQRLQHIFAATGTRNGRQEEVRTTPLFSLAVKHAADHSGGNGDEDEDAVEDKRQESLPLFGLLGFHVGEHEHISEREPLYVNVDAPNSVFLCGSQGSGKSYTLSCMLENCLLPNPDIGQLKSPVAGVVFHYDVNSPPAPAEAAYLCSRGIPVNVFVSRSNERTLTKVYKELGDKLMAVATKEGPPPLYIEVVQRILREMAIRSEIFDYLEFKHLLTNEELTKDQTTPMSLRLKLLESFMDPAALLGSGQSFNWKKFHGHKIGKKSDNKWTFNPQPGSLTIIDLSDTFVDSSTVCLLFDMCLGLVKEQRPEAGLVVGLDEAHKYMNNSTAAALFTDSLLTTIREQRHNSTRVFIATQEPTISEKLLGLCSMTIVHRFSSPAWFNSIKDHLGGASKMISSREHHQTDMFEEIVNLDVGESLVFAPSAFVGMEDGKLRKLGAGALRTKTRARLGTDGGMSRLATGREDSENDLAAAFG